MIYLLKLLNTLKCSSWSYIISFILLIHIIGSSLLIIEPDNFTNYFTYLWWFVVTTSTVGYGDISPITVLGQIIGIIVIIGGVGTLAMVIGKLSEKIIELSTLKLKGLRKYNFSDHIVIMGYHKEETPYIIKEIRKDNKNIKIIFCDDHLGEHPIHEINDVYFVKGNLLDKETLKRASVQNATKILIHADADDESVSVLLGVLNFNENPDTNIVLSLSDFNYNDHIESIVEKMGRKVETVTNLRVPMMVQSLLDSGASDIINQMLGNDDSKILSTSYKGDGTNFGLLFESYKLQNKILIGVNKKLHPSDITPVLKDDIVYYIGRER